MIPTPARSAWLMEVRNASRVWPDSVRPLRSVMVTEANTGNWALRSSSSFPMANRQAFRFRVSKVVSGSNRSTPPSTRPRAWS